MNKSVPVILITVVVLAIVYKRFSSDVPTTSADSPQEISTEEVLSSDLSPSSSDDETIGSSATAGDSELSFEQRVREFKPATREAYRESVKKDPHTTPPELVNSALEIGRLYDSVGNSKQAASLMDLLEECTAHQGSTPTPLKVTCARYARRLNEKYPELKNRYDNLDRQLENSVREILKLNP